jgi:PleD family two-component response regulator
MMTDASTSTNALTAARELVVPPATQKVVIINGNTEIVELLETVLQAGHYDVVFVESTEHAYSQIKRVQPNLVILCVNIEDAAGFRVLSMLNLDKDTRDIPILTYTAECTPDGTPGEEVTELADTDLFAAKPSSVSMN